jgi:hypothetical protein
MEFELLLKREGGSVLLSSILLYTDKRGFGVYSMNQTGGIEVLLGVDMSSQLRLLRPSHTS